MGIANIRAAGLPAAPALCALLLLATAGCVSREVRSVDMTPPQQSAEVIDEQLLLDVGVAVFDANVPENYDEQVEQLIQPEVRRAEANYFPYFAKNLLQSTGNWGAVRVVPVATHAVDVVVNGRILHSTGEQLTLELTVTDATGRQWFSKTYESLASKYAYDPIVPQSIDPFQAVYKALADDMLAFRESLTPAQIADIRATAEMRFARDFAPDAFGDYLRETPAGQLQLLRLPAESDPMLARVRRVRDREYLFIDTLDEYYENYHRALYPPYQNWRRATYEEAIAYKELRAQARARAIGGTVAMVGGVAAMVESDNPAVDVGGLVSIIGGAVTLKSAIAKRAEAEMHGEALQEVGAAAEAEVVPHTLELENQIVRLQGTVEEQYRELRGILRNLYFEDLDLPPPPLPGT
ncbi:MAG: hypothetical protein KF911_15885 [Pseudomonadales bacterium]|nr:hypothetical protein [Pseudomonadales bacterium]